MEKLEELASWQNQVKAVRLQDRLGKQIFHEDMKNVFQPVTETIKDDSDDVTKTMMITSKENNLELENLNNKHLELMNGRGILATYLMSALYKITNPENFSQFKLVKVSNSNRVNDLKINKTISNTLYINLLTFRDTGREFELKSDLFKMITNKNYNVYLASLQDKKLMYDFEKEVNFDLKAQGRKSTRDSTLVKLLKSPSLIVFASGVSTKVLSSNPNKFCDRLKLLLQEKQAGNNSDIINEEVAIVDNLLE